MADMVEIVKDHLTMLAGEGARSYAFPLFDEVNQSYGVILVDFWETHYRPMVLAMVRIVNETVIIDEDSSNRPLVDKLLEGGIPREQIVLAYDDEPYPPEAIPAEVDMA